MGFCFIRPAPQDVKFARSRWHTYHSSLGFVDCDRARRMFEELELLVHHKSLVELLVFSWTKRTCINHLILWSFNNSISEVQWRSILARLTWLARLKLYALLSCVQLRGRRYAITHHTDPTSELKCLQICSCRLQMQAHVWTSPWSGAAVKAKIKDKGKLDYWQHKRSLRLEV